MKSIINNKAIEGIGLYMRKNTFNLAKEGFGVMTEEEWEKIKRKHPKCPKCGAGKYSYEVQLDGEWECLRCGYRTEGWREEEYE